MKRLALLSSLFAVLVGGFVVLAPGLVSIEVVRRSIAYEIAGWGGTALTFDGTPTVSFRPYLTVTFPKARIASSRSGDTLVAMDSLSAQIPLLPLLFSGRIEPTAFDFRRPDFQFVIDAEGRPNWTLPYGLDSTTRVRRLAISDGSVHYRVTGGRAVDLENVDAVLRWPEAEGAASLEGNAEWRGQSGDFSATMGSLRDFFAGKPTALQFAIASPALRAAFVGQAQQIEGLTANGDLSVSTSSIRDVRKLFGWSLADRAAFGAASLHSTLALARQVATLGDARISIDGSDGEGALALDLSGPRPALQATLAFDDFDVTPMADLIGDAIGAARSVPEARLSLTGLQSMDLDMRLSIDRLLYNRQPIGRAAGSAALRSGRLDVALADVRLFDGRLSANLTADSRGPVPKAAIAVRFDGLPLSRLPDRLRPLLAGQGIAAGELSLATEGGRWIDAEASLSGRGSVEVTAGAIDDIDVTALRRSLSDPSVSRTVIHSGSTPFDRTDCEFTIEHGDLRIDDAVATGSGYTLEIGGSAAASDAAGEPSGTIRFGDGEAASVPFVVDDESGVPELEFGPGPSRRSDHGAADGPSALVREAGRLPASGFFYPRRRREPLRT